MDTARNGIPPPMGLPRKRRTRRGPAHRPCPLPAQVRAMAASSSPMKSGSSRTCASSSEVTV